MSFDVLVPVALSNTDFVSVSFSPFIKEMETYLVFIGSSDGSLTAFDHTINEFIDGGRKKYSIKGEIGHIVSRNEAVVLASSAGTLAKYYIEYLNGRTRIFPED